jgi:Na+/phosphate symporter
MSARASRTKGDEHLISIDEEQCFEMMKQMIEEMRDGFKRIEGRIETVDQKVDKLDTKIEWAVAELMNKSVADEK